MQICSVTNQYINNYHYQGVQQANQQRQVKELEKLTDQQKGEKRPRFEIRSTLVVKKNLKPIKVGKL